MRIISQDGNIDIPYENAIITCEECVIKAEMNGLRQFCMGVYSTQEKAQAVLKRLIETYLNCNVANVIGACEGGPSAFGFVKNRVFRFPPDEEAKP